MKLKINMQPLNLDKAETKMILTVTVGAVVSVFCLVSAKALWSQAAYQRHVVNAKHETVNQLKSNLENIETLKTQYETFNKANPNIIGGKNVTDQNAVPPDGDNSRIVLNALPSKYDFPALISSVTYVLNANRITNPGIAGSDLADSVDNAAQANPQPVEIPLVISGLSSYGGAQNLIKDFERSIRPFDVTKVQLSGTSASLSITASLTTYFQPGKILSTGTKEVK